MRVLFRLIVAVLLFGVPAVAWAHGPTRLKMEDSIDIHASPDAVWNRIKNFGDMSWHPAVIKTYEVGGNKPGALRVLTLNNGGKILEELDKYDPSKRMYFYRIELVQMGTLPVTNYASWLTVSDDGKGGSTVDWKGGFYRGFPGNDPPANLSDDAAKKAVHGVYMAGLENLKKLVEGGK
jgi:hypothetical protein